MYGTIIIIYLKEVDNVSSSHEINWWRVDFFLTNHNAPQLLAYAFEFPMTDNIAAMFGDDKVGIIENGIRNYIDSTLSPNPNPNYSDSNLDWTFFGFVMAHNLKMNIKNHYKMANRVIFAKDKRKYYHHWF